MSAPKSKNKNSQSLLIWQGLSNTHTDIENTHTILNLTYKLCWFVLASNSDDRYNIFNYPIISLHNISNHFVK